MEALERGLGLDVVLWLQSFGSPWLGSVLLPFHYLGSESFFLVLVPVIYWSVDESFGRRLSLLFLLSGWNNALFKEWWARPRPFQVSTAVRRLVDASGFGIPSGHAQSAAVLAGALTGRAWRPSTVLFAAVFVFLVGLSRVVHGVHFPQDVVAGWLIGGVFVATFAWSGASLVAWVERQNLATQIALSLGVTVASLALLIGLASSETAQGLRQGMAAIAVFFGASTGFAFETRWVRFQARGPAGKRLLRLLLGLAGIFLLRFGMGVAFGGSSISTPVLTALGYGLMGLWIGLGAPWVFAKARLASRLPSPSRAGRDRAYSGASSE